MALNKIIAEKIHAFLEPHKSMDRQARLYRTNQWESLTYHSKSQQEALADILSHCWKSVPYYRAILESVGFQKTTKISLKSLPILTKKIIRENFDQLTSADLDQRKWYRNKSGGSTGEPIVVIQDQDYLICSEAMKKVCFEWTGYEYGDPLIMLWGAERDILAIKNSLRSKIANYLEGKQVLNSFLMNPIQMKNYLETISRCRPRLIHAYAQSIYELAVFAKSNNMKVIPPQAIVTTAETLYPFMRELIKEVFGCPVYDQYGSRELSCVAFECEQHQGLHVNAETVILEVVDDQGNICPPGVEGEIIVTSLTNYSMPLIRYQTGDVGILDDRICLCGRGAQLLKQVSGRSLESFRLLNGGVISGIYFSHFLGVVFNEGWIEQVQVIQEDYDFVRVRIVPRHGDYSEQNLEQVKRIVRLVMGEACQVEVIIEKEIERSATGKFRYTVCKIDQNT